jgi:hypothetical protein
MLRKRKYAKWKNEEQKEEVDLKTVEPPKPALKKVERVSFDCNEPPISQRQRLRSESQRVCKLESHTNTSFMYLYIHDVVCCFTCFDLNVQPACAGFDYMYTLYL